MLVKGATDEKRFSWDDIETPVINGIFNSENGALNFHKNSSSKSLFCIEHRFI